MKRTLLAGSRCAYLFMTGGGDGSDKNDRAVKEESAEEVEQVEEAEEKKEDHVGTRSNPLPIGQTIEATVHLYNDDFDRFNGSLDLSLEDVVRGADAWARIQEENPFNDEPAEGMEYALSKCLSMHRFTSRSKGRKDHRCSLKRHRKTEKTNDRVVRLFCACILLPFVARNEKTTYPSNHV